MAYTPNVWRDGPAGRTPITAALLGRIENGLSAVAALTDTLLERINAVKTTADGNTTKLQEQAAVQAKLLAASAAVIPIGAAVPFWGLQEPAGFLLCKGQAVSRTTYRELYAVIGTRSGAGDGSTTFNVPDLRESLIYGVGDSGSFAQTMGAAVGEKTHTLTTDEIPAHKHNLSQNGIAHSYGWGNTGNVGTDANAVPGAPSGNKLYTWQGSWNATAETGGGQAFPMRPRGVVANYIIRAK